MVWIRLIKRRIPKNIVQLYLGHRYTGGEKYFCDYILQRGKLHKTDNKFIVGEGKPILLLI